MAFLGGNQLIQLFVRFLYNFRITNQQHLRAVFSCDICCHRLGDNCQLAGRDPRRICRALADVQQIYGIQGNGHCQWKPPHCFHLFKNDCFRQPFIFPICYIRSVSERFFSRNRLSHVLVARCVVVPNRWSRNSYWDIFVWDVFGLVLGTLLPSHFIVQPTLSNASNNKTNWQVVDRNTCSIMWSVQLFFSILGLALIVLLASNHPPTPPTLVQEKEQRACKEKMTMKNFLSTCKILVRNKQFFAHCHSCCCYAQH